MKCVIKQYGEINKEKWDRFVYDNSMGWAYFLYDIIALDRNNDYINKCFAIVDVENQDEILMIVMLHKTNHHPIKSRLRLKRELLKSRWGYVLKDGLTRKQHRQVKEAFENYIDEYMSKDRIKVFDINLAPLSEFMQERRNSYVNPLMDFNFVPGIRYTYVVDLSKSKEKLLADCNETTRQDVRKIEKLNKYIIIESNGSEGDFNTHVRLHKETYIRTNSEDRIISDEYHKNIFFNLIPQKLCRVFFLKDTEKDSIVASLIILVYKNIAYYWWGASNNDRELGMNKYFMFKVISIMQDLFNNTGYFETGGAHQYLRKGKNKGLNDFKKCFGTFLMPIYTGKYCK